MADEQSEYGSSQTILNSPKSLDIPASFAVEFHNNYDIQQSFTSKTIFFNDVDL